MLKYVGNGMAWVVEGVIVPRRDLDDEDVRRFGGEATLLKSGLYEKPKSRKESKGRKEMEVSDGDKRED